MSKFVLAIAAACGAAVILSAATQRPNQESKGADEKATQSAKQLLNVARRGLELAEKTPAGSDDYIWSRRVLNAEINLCGNANERIAARDRYLKRTAKLEEAAKRAFENGVGTKSDLLEAEYRRCEAAMELEVEQAASTGRSK